MGMKFLLLSVLFASAVVIVNVAKYYFEFGNMGLSILYGIMIFIAFSIYFRFYKSI